jgi:hypothetical protein
MSTTQQVSQTPTQAPTHTPSAAGGLPMPLITIVFATLLFGLGVAMYMLASGAGAAGGAGGAGGGGASRTALLPAVFGIPFLVLGLLAMALPKQRKHLMHASAAVATLVALMGLGMAAASLARAGFDVNQLGRPRAVLAQGIMGSLSLGYVLLCVKSFVDARKARQAVGASR